MTRMLMAVLWPAFLVAIVAEGLFFSIFDPVELVEMVASAGEHRLPPLGIYTFGFFFFWAIGTGSGLLGRYLEREDVAVEKLR